MHITKYSDYSLRMLMYLALQPTDTLVSIADISDTFDISRNHLMKIANDLANAGIIKSVRGRNGGIQLGKPAEKISIGKVIRQLEPIDKVVDCESGPCLFQNTCVLSDAIDKATHAFFAELDNYTLADLVKSKTKLNRVIRMHHASAA